MDPFNTITNFRYGDYTPFYFEDEVWKNLHDVDPIISNVYYISTYGRIYDKSNGYMLAPQISDINGYSRIRLRDVNFNRINRLVHVLVGQAFIPNPNNEKFLNHIGTIRHNCVYTNLEWCSRSYNNQYAYDIGNNIRGENHKFAKHSEETIHIICNVLQNNISMPDIVRTILNITDDNEYKLMYKTVLAIKSRKKWKGVSQYYNF